MTYIAEQLFRYLIDAVIVVVVLFAFASVSYFIMSEMWWLKNYKAIFSISIVLVEICHHNTYVYKYVHVYIADSPINVHRSSQIIQLSFVSLNILDLSIPIVLYIYICVYINIYLSVIFHLFSWLSICLFAVVLTLCRVVSCPVS